MKNILIVFLICTSFIVPVQANSTYNAKEFCDHCKFENTFILTEISVNGVFFHDSSEETTLSNSSSNRLKAFLLKINSPINSKLYQEKAYPSKDLGILFNELKKTKDRNDHLSKIIPKDTSSYLFSYIDTFTDQFIPVHVDKNYFPIDVNDVLGFGVRLRL